jgi:hypothetical protein
VERRFISISDVSNVTVGDLREAADRVGADLAVVVLADQAIRTVQPADLAEVDTADAVADHINLGTSLEDASPVGVTGARVAFESDFAVVLRHGDALLVPTRGEQSWDELHSNVLEAYAPMARLPGEVPEPPDPPIYCTCRYGDVIWGPASDPPRECADGHPVICQ